MVGREVVPAIAALGFGRIGKTALRTFLGSHSVTIPYRGQLSNDAASSVLLPLGSSRVAGEGASLSQSPLPNTQHFRNKRRNSRYFQDLRRFSVLGNDPTNAQHVAEVPFAAVQL
jgi:hypothetical protein